MNVVVAALFAQSGKSNSPRPLSKHIALALSYLSLLPILVNLIPSSILPTRASAILLTLASTVAALGVHVSCVAVINSSKLRKSHGRDLDDAEKKISELRLQISPKNHGEAPLIEPNVHCRVPGNAVLARTVSYATVSEYRSAIADLEATAHEFSFIQHRIAPYFKTDGGIDDVALIRYGEGSPDADGYRHSQTSRKKSFAAHLAAGNKLREIYPRDKITLYARTGALAPKMWPMKPSEVVASLVNWKHALENFDSYFVGIADVKIPLKYHIIDREVVILHEPIGRGESHRLNSIFIYGSESARPFVDDFELLWSLIPSEWRSTVQVASWIESELIPLAQKRKV
ncbi:hypothetical protein AB0C38_04515 [Amycolatopsis sp. NPDC048633]|uniref:hypothetical protein n=1 Tax=Amycolatopsis sp. NPDC048633 TaxID=3157095 RepID=UPI0033D4677B